VDVELSPEQRPEIAEAVSSLILAAGLSLPDPWWQAGIDDALET
jgi:hypothetical protein